MTPDDRPAGQRNGHKTTRVTNGLVALGSASVLAIYAVGFARTKAASEQFEDDAAPRRRPAPVPAAAPVSTMSLPPLAETAPPAAAPRSGGVEQAPAARTAAAATSEAPAPRSSPLAARQEAPSTATKASAASVSQDATAVAATPGASTSAAAPATSPAAPATDTPAASTAVTTATPAPAAVAAAATASLTAPKTVVLKDGSYTGWGTCRHGDIQATVVIASGRIQSATISQCWTRYPCSWISPLPPQVAQRQSAEVDYVSGATQSTNAFYDAVMDALAKAK